MRGQVSLSVAIAGAVATVLVGAMGSWATASNRVSMVETKVEVLQERQELQYREIKEGLRRLENKLDRVLEL